MMTKKRKTAVSSVPVFPSDVERDILSRLPAKSLVRFKSVGRSWYRSLVVDDPTFVALHMSRVSKHKGTTNFLVCTCSPLLPYYSCYRDDTGWRFQPVASTKGLSGFIIGSINGLFCLTNLKYSWPQKSNDDLKFSVWNPTTREIMELPSPRLESGDYEANCGAYIHFISFGFCPKVNDYKVIKVLGSRRFHPSRPREGQVYSLSKNSWKSIRIENQGWVRWQVPELRVPNVFLNGASHWLARRENSPGRILIMSFKFEEEVFLDIMPPNHRFDERDPLNLFITEYRDSLSLVAKQENNFDVWVMKEYGVADSWVKQFSIDVGKVQIHWPGHFSLVHFEDNNGEVEELLVVVYPENQKRLFRYNTETRELKDLGFWPVGQVIRWKESVVSLPGMIGIP